MSRAHRAMEIRMDDYPSEDDLRLIQEWPITDKGWLEFVQATWIKAYGSATHNISAHEAGVMRAEKDAKYLRLATGGWSGNEVIIYAMRRNMLWGFAWQLSARGGLHIFEFPR